jgi:t-SNARE complex subunit (syntaxin)
MSHDSLRKELAAAQQEAQRLQAQGQAAMAAEEQEARGILDKVAKMEADLKARDPVKAELQQAHAEAQGLVVARQQLAADTQKLSKDLQRNLGEAQQLPALVAERDAARQEYQHLRCRAI